MSSSTQAVANLLDRWIPSALRVERRTLLRARVLVCGCVFAVVASLIIEPLRLAQESQHWVAITSWAVCTLLLMLGPVVLRVTGRLSLSGAIVSIGILVGSLGVAVKEGGMASPNAMVMIVGPVVATMLGGPLSGAFVSALVTVASFALYSLHDGGVLAAESPLEAATLVTMRAVLLPALSTVLYLFTLFYETERNRNDAELTSKAQELERARDAVVEAAEIKIALLASQRRELERDLELTAAVQKLLIPKRDSLQTPYVGVAGFNVPASQCGGDWWFMEQLRDGRVRVLIGDVTGHGAAPAMVAAVVAGAFRALQAEAQLETPELLESLHGVLRDVGLGTYTMPFGVLEVSPRGHATWFSAAATPVLLLRQGGGIDTLSATGNALGSETFQVGEARADLAPGDRLLLTSDGVLELPTRAGHQLGLRRLVRLARVGMEHELPIARDKLAAAIDETRGDAELADDLTFAIVELTSRVPHGAVVDKV